MLAFLLVLATSLFWLWLIARHDDHEREPWPLLLLAGALGALAAGGVLWARPMLENWLAPLSPLLEVFVVTALAEEAWKLLAFLPLLCLRELDEPLDGAVYGVTVGLGFATVENLHFASAHADFVALLQRTSTASLVHLAASGCAGLCLAEAKLRRFGLGTFGWIRLGIGVAVGAHGCYDLFLGGDRAQALLSLLVVLPVMAGLLAMKVHWARSRSRDFHP